ncbi:aminomethyl-transferring glycine dehydrogenase [Cryobacterium sp. TMT1-21]|uniref:aminomethyl-transferring glycine dehydrogenase n=1 Tax=unclassified Cryobacterium TaxID=2649013 RepID=UPI00106B782C|nr:MULTISPECIES: aminomethyl-transferring glycine dehydrogenase [unclassified Cryobacterium]TFD17053.1 aminomethyl-transferring glycine dehydrogenase [Cryobacterium sp. TMT1-21]TFD18202.1 aminomethyl-transferring glycine dehydrogenase [Cryobacterium sp. TMT2-23]
MSQPFTQRHIGTDADAQSRMLAILGYDSVDALVNAAVPASIQVDQFRVLGDSTLPPAATEREAIAELRTLADRNTVKRSMIGQGYYDTVTPAVIKRNVFENPSWYTAYTPYQPEISQGRLEALINFQTMIADLTGLSTANASMLDESTAVVEGMLLTRRASKSKSNRFIVDADALPQTKALLANRAAALGIDLVEIALADVSTGGAGQVATGAATVADLGEHFGIFVQYPGASGRVWNPAAVIAAAQAQGALTVVAADLLALTLITSPGELGADVAVGTSQRFGVPMGFGGPHAGYMAVRQGLERQLPGRLVGVSVDAVGHPAYRLSLQVREQHIRRDKATSNICTAQVLLAVMAGMYAVYHGPDGLKTIARQVHERAGQLVVALLAAGADVVTATFFDTVRVSSPGRAAEIVAAAADGGVNLHLVDADTIGISVDETTTLTDLALVVGAFGGRESFGLVDFSMVEAGLPPELHRTSEFLTHPVFNTHRSETSMMRYLKRLADYDYALDRGMIPLGSCTMKLNAATEMEAVSWPEFGGLHPFAPRADVEGYLELVRQIETWLSDVTGYDSVSLQPNAGSQGELAGLLAIRGYHLSNGDAERLVCLIPSSAHGTNAASAVLAGMKVVVVACDELGNVDLDDLRAKIAVHADNLAALMITYPSTHGVYEHEVGAICRAVHDAGGQVYVDGANLNALLGFARYGDFGGDVSHLNLHKTFCIPHGGGGPGVGPVAAKAHLAPFLPGHPLAQSDEHYLLGAGGGAGVGAGAGSGDGSGGTIVHAGGPVSAAPYGSPSILPISWAYVRMMGAEGLKEATGAAVLAANYVAKRLDAHFPVLYSGDNGLVAHECILDLRPLTEATGVTVDDVAKRLVDYGFHAPTMSFPVSGTLMIEPTESEDLGEIDRFVEAMIAIKAEADAVASGRWPADDNPLHNAPHTAQSVIEGEWTHAYDRETAVYPVRSLIRGKYWPPVRRIDNAFGDRNLVCACPPPEAFE